MLIEWAVRRPHLSVIPLAMLLVFGYLLTLPIHVFDANSGPTRPAVGTPPALPAGPESAVEQTDSGCDDLVQLESTALLGRLSIGQVACLEASFAAATHQTDTKKVSLLLIANANGRGDKDEWEALVLRHLREIDWSDPDICYAYATHLARKGPGRAEAVIRWSDAALENRPHWEGDTFNSRVYGLYKLRAAAANTLFRQSERRDERLQTDESFTAAQQAQERLQAYSREWLKVARLLGKNAETPLQLCLEVSQSVDLCEGE